ncbi:MAG: helix-turn-helix domain-containing protein [bacterium]|nr:helix-turn-helix domain-containing protein [bacterium]
MFHILRGNGAIEVDFKPIHNWEDKLIFLEKGQYIKFLSEGFEIQKIEFDDDLIFENKDFRVLFKHLVSLGYIGFNDCKECQRYLQSSILSNPHQILDISTKQWFWQNPFNAETSEYHVIFDVKELLDQNTKHHLQNQDIFQLLGNFDLNPQKLFKDKIGITVKSLLNKKRTTDIQKEVAFSSKSMQEIAYDFGFKDPAYFNRTFKESNGVTPMEFRTNNDFIVKDLFIQDFFELISKHHMSQHQAGFYAEEMNLSLKTLSRKVREKLHVSIGQLIRMELIKTAKTMLAEGQTVKEIAYQLKFEESNHFSAFFKHHTNLTPTEYTAQKVQ